MYIPLDPIKNVPGRVFEFSWSLDPHKLDIADGEAAVAEPLDISLHVTYRDGNFILEGSLRAFVAMQCGRCLKQFTFPLIGEIMEEIPAVDLLQLDLAELVREIYYTSLPLKPLCRDTCKGLCAVCGADLNLKQCDCHLMSVDHRMAVLKKLLEK